MSSGLTSYGYDARIGYKFKVFKPYPCTVIDPKNFDPRMLEDVDLTPLAEHEWFSVGHHLWECSHCKGRLISDAWPNPGVDSCPTRPSNKPDHILIPPHSFILGETVEEFDIPRDVLAVVVGKSTYARCGLIVNVTPLEPEWKGKVTVEISNTTPLPAKVYAGEGIMQVMFFRTDEATAGLYEHLHRIHTRGYFQAADDLRKEMERSSCRTSYKDKGGRYMGQPGVTTPTVDTKETN